MEKKKTCRTNQIKATDDPVIEEASIKNNNINQIAGCHYLSWAFSPSMHTVK